MNRYQKIALALFAGNLLLILLFPPVDEYTIVSTAVPVFSGFRFVGDAGPRTVLNESFLTLEVLVLLANAGIVWLLLRDRPRSMRRNRLSLQNTVLLVTGVNLVAVLLFPPFESVFQMTRATIPTFEGFYFVFDQKPAHVIVTTLLYIEVFFIIANGALFWLLFRPRRPEPTPEQLLALMQKPGKEK
jgi:hypothetical protein